MASDSNNPLRAAANPHLLEINARTWLRRLANERGRPLTLAEIPEAALETIRERGFDAVWLMGVWRSGEATQEIARSHPRLRSEYDRALPDWTPADVGGSPYSIAAYEVAADLGGDAALAELRVRLRRANLGLVLDFVPNHLARDHDWVRRHPCRLVQGTDNDLREEPGNWYRVDVPGQPPLVLAHGRDPGYLGWTDTVQVDIRRRETRQALIRLMLQLATRCDGLRCDVAMLLLNDVFHRTWEPARTPAAGSDVVTEFWADAIRELRRRDPDCVLIAEAFRGHEMTLAGLGFDYAYDKGLTDALATEDFVEVEHRMSLALPDQRWRVRFLENHDEPRAFTTFGPDRLAAVSAFLYTLPGMRFFQEGQAEGRRTRVPIQLTREPQDAPVDSCREFHERLFALLKDAPYHRGTWTPLSDLRTTTGAAGPAGVFGSRWTFASETRFVVVNLGSQNRQVIVPLTDAAGRSVPLRWTDEWAGTDLTPNLNIDAQPCISIDVEPHGFHFLGLTLPPGQTV